MEDNTEMLTKTPADAVDAPAPTGPRSRESHIMNVSVRGIITMGVVGTICAMAMRAIKVEEPLYSISFLCLGYYFGQGKAAKTTTPN